MDVDDDLGDDDVGDDDSDDGLDGARDVLEDPHADPDAKLEALCAKAGREPSGGFAWQPKHWGFTGQTFTLWLCRRLWELGRDPTASPQLVVASHALLGRMGPRNVGGGAGRAPRKSDLKKHASHVLFAPNGRASRVAADSLRRDVLRPGTGVFLRPFFKTSGCDVHLTVARIELVRQIVPVSSQLSAEAKFTVAQTSVDAKFFQGNVAGKAPSLASLPGQRERRRRLHYSSEPLFAPDGEPVAWRPDVVFTTTSLTTFTVQPNLKRTLFAAIDPGSVQVVAGAVLRRFPHPHEDAFGGSALWGSRAEHFVSIGSWSGGAFRAARGVTGRVFRRKAGKEAWGLQRAERLAAQTRPGAPSLVAHMGDADAWEARMERARTHCVARGLLSRFTLSRAEMQAVLSDRGRELSGAAWLARAFVKRVRGVRQAELGARAGHGDLAGVPLVVFVGNGRWVRGGYQVDHFLEALVKIPNVYVVKKPESHTSARCPYCAHPAAEVSHPVAPHQSKVRNRDGSFRLAYKVVRGESRCELCRRSFSRDAGAAAYIGADAFSLLRTGKRMIGCSSVEDERVLRLLQLHAKAYAPNLLDEGTVDVPADSAAFWHDKARRRRLRDALAARDVRFRGGEWEAGVPWEWVWSEGEAQQQDVPHVSGTDGQQPAASTLA